MDRWPIDDVSEALRKLIPPKPRAKLSSCLAGGRAVLDRVVKRECDLRMMWEEAPDGGEAFHSAVARLRAALADE